MAGGPTLSPSTPTPTPTPQPWIDFGTSYAPEAGRNGGSIRIGDWQEANQFNPYLLGGPSEERVAAAVWASLLRRTPDGVYQADLAASIPTTANGGVRVPGEEGDAMTVTWTLRPGLLWSDGQALTCDDFKYAWEWVLDPDNLGVSTAGFEDIRAVDCPTPTQMIWHFSAVYEAYLTLMPAPLPRHYLSQFPVKDQVTGAGFGLDDLAKLPVSGAFSFKSIQPGTELRLQMNPNARSWATGKAPHLDTLVWRWYADPASLVAAYRAKAVDVAVGLADLDTPTLSKLGEQVSTLPAVTYESLVPNWSDAGDVDAADGVGGCSRNEAVAFRGTGCPMADPALRSAISWAIDRETIRTQLFGGQVRVAPWVVRPESWFFSDGQPPRFDPARARKILAAAAWVPLASGIRAKNGLRATIELCTSDEPFRRDLAPLIVGWLKDVGIEVIPTIVPADQLAADPSSANVDAPCVLARSNFDLAEVTRTSAADPLDLFFAYDSSQVIPNGTNIGSVRDPDLDAALARIEASADFGEVRDAASEAQRIVAEQTVEIPLVSRAQIDLFAPKVGNALASSWPGGSTWNVVDWFVRK